MAEDFDVEAMLEAPYKKDEEDARSPGHHRHISGSSSNHQHNGRKRENGKRRSRTRSRSPNKERSRSNDKENSRERDHGHVSRNRDKSRDRAMDVKSRGDKDKRRSSRDRGDRRRSKERRRSRSKDKKQRSRSRDNKKRSRSKEKRRRSRSRGGGGVDGKSRNKSKERRRSRSREPREPRERRRSRSKDRKRTKSKDRKIIVANVAIPPSRRRTPSPRPFRRGRTPPNGLGDRTPPEDLSPEERDARTVFCMQLSQRIRARDLEEFFSSVGKVRDVRLITCNKTKRFKGIAYIEFKDPESVPLALGLSNQRLLGIPICVQHTQAEKNRMANVLPNIIPKNHVGPMRLYVGSLHFNINEDMLRGIFEPFGKIDSIQLIMDPETGRSKGYGFITFHNADDAKKALDQLNGFELAGRPMKVGNVTERLDVNTNASLDTDEMDRSGIDLGATGRLQLMFKLAEGAGLAVPQAAANALLATAPQPVPMQPPQPAPSIATQCFMLSNMFDPATETNTSWEVEIEDDVIEECKKHGGVLHVYVDQSSSTGNVYVKCPSIATAVLAVNALHGRWFAGRVITAAYVPLVNYHTLFPDALTATALLQTTRKS